MSYIFKMGEKDYSNNITVPNYEINSEAIYREYTDCNYVVHREIARKKISGSFTLLFNEKSDFAEFANYIKDHTLQDGSILVSVYVNNLMEVKDIYAYIEWTPSNDLPFYGAKKLDGYDITITER